MNASALFDSVRTSAWTGALCLLAGLAAPAGAATVDLYPTPPDLTSTVAPNLMLTLDDSGSMGRNFMGDQRPYSGSGWGATDQQNVDSSVEYPSGGSPYLCAGVIDPAVTDPANPRSWAMNGAYYNPNATYLPPLLADGITSMPDAPFGGAWDNGIIRNRPSNPGSSTARNLNNVTRFCGRKAGYFKLNDSVALTLDADGRIDAASRTRLYTAGNWTWVNIADNGTAAQKKNFANWYSYYHTRHLAAKTALSRAFAPFDDNIRIAWQNINANQIGANTAIYKFRNNATNNNVRTRFYNWLFDSPVSGGTPNQAATVRAGEFFKRSTGARDTNPYWDRDLERELSCRQNFHINMSDGFWNGGTSTTATNDRAPATRTLPDGKIYSTSEAESSIFWRENGPDARSMADIAFHYWATDLRPDFATDESTRLKVPPYVPDDSTNLFGVPIADPLRKLDNKEVYWNPVNDPATWPHLVQYMIGFGISGTIPKNDNTYDRLRRGLLAWPETVAGTDDARKVDDIWHAAINSRGEFFAASNPNELVSALSAIISNIIARRGSSTALSATMAILTSGTQGFSAGYDTNDWTGTLTKSNLDASTGDPQTPPLWDAGCVLSGGERCISTGQTDLPATDPADRNIYTWNGSAGVEFLWGNLNTAQRTALNRNPNPSITTPDNHGSRRVDYLRGDRSAETAAPFFRRRNSVLGAIVNSQPVYVSGPTSGWEDSFPIGSAEAEAADPVTGAGSYAEFIWTYRDRAPTVYAGANDGMLHAFNAVDGSERFAYVPNVLFETGKLNQITDKANVVSVDDMPVVQDVFINGRWRTVLVGSLRLGGRGIFALDVTEPDGFGAGDVLWEFSNHSAGGEVLGYTYGSANIARLNNGKWVVLVSSGYYPSLNTDPYGFPDPARLDSNADRTSLLVIDLESGALIREIRTSGASITYGLSTPAGYDLNGDQVDDIAVAGDLAGNLWRFDLSSPNPASWSVDLMFTTYAGGNPSDPGRQPISVMPVAMRDFATSRPIWIFGTGKYLGKDDRSNEGTPSNDGPQAFYGIRDYGSRAEQYPIRAEQLVAQTLSQSGNVRSITTNLVPASSRGWKIPLTIATERSERNVIGITPLYSSNRAVLTTLIPKGDDPCDPGRRGSVMVVDAATGGVPGNGYGGMPSLGGAQSNEIGVVVNSTAIPISGYPSLVSRLGAAGIVMPGIPEVQIPDAPNYRGAWRELLDLL